MKYHYNKFAINQETKRAHPQSIVQITDLFDFGFREIKGVTLQVFNKPAVVVGLGNDGDTTLSRPSKEHLCNSWKRLSH